MSLKIFRGKILKSSFEQVSDELYASKYDFWSLGVPKYNIICIFEKTIQNGLKFCLGQVSDELWASKYDFWTHWVPKHKIQDCEDIWRKNLKSCLEQVSDELWPSKYDFWSQTVPKYNIIYVLRKL